MSPTGSDVLNDGLFAPLATIQLAVHYANDGDTILLAPGRTGGSDCTTFEGEFHGASKRRCNYNIDYMGKKITIDGRGHATVDCDSFGYMPYTWIHHGKWRDTLRLSLKESLLSKCWLSWDILSETCIGGIWIVEAFSIIHHHKCNSWVKIVNFCEGELIVLLQRMGPFFFQYFDNCSASELMLPALLSRSKILGRWSHSQV